VSFAHWTSAVCLVPESDAFLAKDMTAHCQDAYRKVRLANDAHALFC